MAANQYSVSKFTLGWNKLQKILYKTKLQSDEEIRP